MSAKIIIHIGDNIDTRVAVARVQGVIAEGLISGDGQSYCYVTRYADSVMVTTDKPRDGSSTHTFHVYREHLGRG